MRKIKRFSILAGLIFILQLSFGSLVYAAEGQLSIAVSETTVQVGETVTVTLRGAGPGGKNAVSDMKFTYDAEVFSFVSCSEDTYYGGEGGQVNVSGSKVDIKLKAVAEGNGFTKVSGSNGRIADTGESLSEMVAAGVRIDVVSSANNDNSLQSLSLSAGELSPEFSQSTMEYTAVVPYDITEVQVDAVASHEAASVESIMGASDLQVGENQVTVTVVAENGESATYTIVITREAEIVENVPEEEQDSTTIEEYQDKISFLQQENQKLEERYQSEKMSSRRTIIILIIIIIILVFTCINLVLFKKREEEEELDFGKVQKEKKKQREKREKRQKKEKREKKERLSPEEEPEKEIKKEMVLPEKSKSSIPPEKGVEVIDFDDMS